MIIGRPLLLACALLLSASSAFAAPAQSEQQVSRRLNGHNFVRSELVAWPFPSTYFGTSFGVGAFRFDVPQGLDANGNPQSGTIDAAAMAPRLDMGIGFADWFGLQFGANGSVATGTNVGSAINFGAIFQAQFGGRLVARIWRGETVQIAAAFGGDYTLGKSVNPLLMISEMLDSGNFSPDKLLTDVKSWALAPETMVAFAPISWLGLQTSFAFRFGETTIGDLPRISDKQLLWGLGATLDLAAVFPGRLPRRLPAGGADRHRGRRVERPEHFIEGGLVYSGRSNLDLGVLASTQLKANSKQYVGVFRMYYHW